MRVADAVGIGDDDERRVRALPDRLRDGLDGGRRVGVAERLDDIGRRCHGMADGERPLLVLLFDLPVHQPDRDERPREDRGGDHDDLEEQDLARELTRTAHPYILRQALGSRDSKRNDHNDPSERMAWRGGGLVAA